MKRNFLLILPLLLLLLLAGSVSAECVIHISEYGTLQETIAAIPLNAGDVTILLDQPHTREAAPDEEPASIILPLERGITSLRLMTELEKADVKGLDSLYLGGIPFTLGAAVDMDQTSIYGGGYAGDGETIHLPTSDLTIEGNAGFIIGGGYAGPGGTSIVDETRIIQGADSLILYEVIGGGHAQGEGAAVEVGSSYSELSGTCDYVLGGGFAEYGGESRCETGKIIIREGGSVAISLFTGGSAADETSQSTVGNSEAELYGTAEWAFAGDFAYYGGQAETTGVATLRILQDGHAGALYAGGYASDPGSTASVHLAELHSCKNADLVTMNGQTADGGEVIVTRKAHFDCSE